MACANSADTSEQITTPRCSSESESLNKVSFIPSSESIDLLSLRFREVSVSFSKSMSTISGERSSVCTVSDWYSEVFSSPMYMLRLSMLRVNSFMNDGSSNIICRSTIFGPDEWD